MNSKKNKRGILLNTSCEKYRKTHTEITGLKSLL